ncbi:MAG: hypothetical protein ACN2B6_06655 [Rickettsiales bacterium]
MTEIYAALRQFDERKLTKTVTKDSSSICQIRDINQIIAGKGLFAAAGVRINVTNDG